MDCVKMPNSVKDTVTTEENPYSFRNLEIAEFFFYIFLVKSTWGFCPAVGIPGYFLPLNISYLLEKDVSLDSC